MPFTLKSGMYDDWQYKHYRSKRTLNPAEINPIEGARRVLRTQKTPRRRQTAPKRDWMEDLKTEKAQLLELQQERGWLPRPEGSHPSTPSDAPDCQPPSEPLPEIRPEDSPPTPQTPMQRDMAGQSPRLNRQEDHFKHRSHSARDPLAPRARKEKAWRHPGRTKLQNDGIERENKRLHDAVESIERTPVSPRVNHLSKSALDQGEKTYRSRLRMLQKKPSTAQQRALRTPGTPRSSRPGTVRSDQYWLIPRMDLQGSQTSLQSFPSPPSSARPSPRPPRDFEASYVDALERNLVYAARGKHQLDVAEFMRFVTYKNPEPVVQKVVMAMMVLVSPEFDESHKPSFYWRSFLQWVVELGSVGLWIHNLQTFNVASASLRDAVRSVAIVESTEVRDALNQLVDPAAHQLAEWVRSTCRSKMDWDQPDEFFKQAEETAARSMERSKQRRMQRAALASAQRHKAEEARRRWSEELEQEQVALVDKHSMEIMRIADRHGAANHQCTAVELSTFLAATLYNEFAEWLQTTEHTEEDVQAGPEGLRLVRHRRKVTDFQIDEDPRLSTDEVQAAVAAFLFKENKVFLDPEEAKASLHTQTLERMREAQMTARAKSAVADGWQVELRDDRDEEDKKPRYLKTRVHA